MSDMTREQLEARANELDVKFAANIGDDTLRARVEEAEKARAARAGEPEAGVPEAAPAAPAPAGATGAPATPPEPKDEPLAAPLPDGASGLVVEVIGPKGGFRRAGRSFGPDPVLIPIEQLSEDEKAALIGEPKLLVTTKEIPS